MNTAAGVAKMLIERSGNARTFSLSSGERAGVRAVVNQILFFLAWRRFGVLSAVALACVQLHAEQILLTGATVHTVSGETLSPGQVLVEDGKILEVGKTVTPKGSPQTIDLKSLHLYPGMIALNTDLGLVEIDAVRATRDDRESGEGYTPEVLSWLAVNPDSEMLPVARANGVSHFEPVPTGNTVAGQSGLVAISGWTSEQMAIKKPIALHVFWPSANLQTNPRERGRTRERPKPLEEQAKEYREKSRL
jgi:imidazolonepropionase-like amidohydrolase